MSFGSASIINYPQPALTSTGADSSASSITTYHHQASWIMNHDVMIQQQPYHQPSTSINHDQPWSTILITNLHLSFTALLLRCQDEDFDDLQVRVSSKREVWGKIRLWGNLIQYIHSMLSHCATCYIIYTYIVCIVYTVCCCSSILSCLIW